MTIAPTVLVYGTPENYSFFSDFIRAEHWGLALDNGQARDPIFTIYENFARADALICFPNAHPLHLVTVMAEAEVGHPLITIAPGKDSKNLRSKPIIFFGDKAAWQPFLQIFSAMRDQGLTRESFDRLVYYTNNFEEARDYIVSALPEAIPSTRINYYVHSKRAADTQNRLRPDIRPPSNVTVACFGSASTKNPQHLARAEAVARALVHKNFNILHGGGVNGVMGELTKAGNRLKGFVKGVTVDQVGAPKIFFERAAGGGVVEEVDQYIAAKDMLHRIETYAGNSEAFISLDGGVGSVQEVLMIAELRSERHPVIMFETQAGEHMLKPLWLLNEGKIYDPLLKYLETQGLAHLRGEILVANSVSELEENLGTFFDAHQPLPHSIEDAAQFRSKYHEV